MAGAALLAADGLLGRGVGPVGFGGLFGDVEVHIGRNLGPEVALAEERREDRVDALDVAFFQLAGVFDLGGVEVCLQRVGLLGEQAAFLVDDAHVVVGELGHARCDQVHDAGDLRRVEGASGVQAHHHRGGGLLLLAEEAVLVRQRQVDAGVLHAADR